MRLSAGSKTIYFHTFKFPPCGIASISYFQKVSYIFPHKMWSDHSISAYSNLKIDSYKYKMTTMSSIQVQHCDVLKPKKILYPDSYIEL